MSSFNTKTGFSSDLKIKWSLFFGVICVALAFALYTDHAWEDWFITYRASKNLATGNGLVFSVGEKVHTFTSPLCTLIPALLSFITSSNSESLVLWLFRIISCLLLGFSAVMLFRIAASLRMKLLATVVMIGLFAFDAKIIDFSINGQEAAFMMFFLIASIYSLSVSTRRVTVMLALSWAGLLWTRPDSFVYIGALSLGYLIFRPETPTITTRSALLKVLTLAGALAALLYLPWTVWTWSYYGTPIPHTVIAKGLINSNQQIDLLKELVYFPYKSIFSDSSVGSTFMPSYSGLGGWPYYLQIFYGVLAIFCCYCWCMPFVSPYGRAFSFTLFLGHIYLNLTDVIHTVYPWYFPSVTLLSILVIGQIISQVTEVIICHKAKLNSWGFRSFKAVLSICCGFTILLTVATTLAVAYQMKTQQEIIEEIHRKEIGLWLKAHAESVRDTVFLECLGYIGFYSNLKMLDVPGLSSPEVVAMRRSLGTDDDAALIANLQPDWLVLRPDEINFIHNQEPALLTADYQVEKVFDVTEKIYAQRFLPGREYLLRDAVFVVFKRKP